MIFPAFSHRPRFGSLLFAIALAVLLAAAARRDIPVVWGRDALVAPEAESAVRAPRLQASCPRDHAVETLPTAWLCPLLAAPVLVSLLESDSP